MKYQSFKPLPEQLANKYKNMFINDTKHIYYEPNPSFTEEELDKISLDFIKLYDIIWHGLPDQVSKLIKEEFEDCLQTEPFPEEKVGEKIKYLCDDGIYDGEGNKLMSLEDFLKNNSGKQLMVNVRPEVHKKLILEGKPIGDRDCVYLDDFLLVVRDYLRKGGFSHNKILNEDIVKDLCVKWNKDSKEVREIIRNIKLLQDLTENSYGIQNKSITIKANKSDIFVEKGKN